MVLDRTVRHIHRWLDWFGALASTYFLTAAMTQVDKPTNQSMTWNHAKYTSRHDICKHHFWIKFKKKKNTHKTTEAKRKKKVCFWDIQCIEVSALQSKLAYCFCCISLQHKSCADGWCKLMMRLYSLVFSIYIAALRHRLQPRLY